jgi:hypothetical protein
VKYCDVSADPATYPYGRARYFNGVTWDWIGCREEAAWHPSSCDDGLSMSPNDLFGINPRAGFCDIDGTPPCAGSGSAGDYITAFNAAGGPVKKLSGDFTECAPGCAFQWTSGSTLGGGSRGGGPWKSACINLDPWHVHRYGPDGSPTKRRGERGSIHFITRLDLSDDGPLGACNNTYASHRITTDRGTCMTGGADNFALYSVPAPDFDGVLAAHPGTGQTSLFSRTVNNQDPWLPATRTPSTFCSPSNAGEIDELYALIEEVLANASPMPNAGDTTATWGVCKYSTSKVNGVELGWYVESCDDPGVYRFSSASVGNGVYCGCGLLGFKATGVSKLPLDNNNNRQAIVWRGLIAFASQGNATGIELDPNGNNSDKLLFLDGGFLAVMTGAAAKLSFDAQWDFSTSSTPKVYIRFNQGAISEALSQLDIPVRGFRVLY